ncbi:hypothetical protein EDB85DRAFT_1988836 [Lactarius pseudohatsudake]|nr:hypothetical protein EDB85DRAFT_1988836 [Lactarius pseudohatsudake]
MSSHPRRIVLHSVISAMSFALAQHPVPVASLFLLSSCANNSHGSHPHGVHPHAFCYLYSSSSPPRRFPFVPSVIVNRFQFFAVSSHRLNTVTSCTDGSVDRHI